MGCGSRLTYRCVTATRAQKVEISASMTTPVSGTATASVVKSPVRATVGSGIAILVFVFVVDGNKMLAAPVREFVQLPRRREPDRARDVKLDAGCERYPPPQRALGRRLALESLENPRRLVSSVARADGLPDFVERATRLLHRLDAQESIEV